MTEFNSCAALLSEENLKEATAVYQEIKNLGESPFDYLLDLQNRLQQNLESQYPGRTVAPHNIKTKGELAQFLLDQKHAFDDEFQELLLSVAGTNKSAKDQTTIWKKWKSGYETLRAEGVNEGLNQNEIAERDFEIIDMVMFLNNILLALGFDEQKLFQYYYLKNLENVRRYKGNY